MATPAPVASLAVSSGWYVLASASWDRTVRLWPLAGGEHACLKAMRRTSTELPSRRTERCGQCGLRCDSAHLAAHRRRRRPSVTCRRRSMLWQLRLTAKSSPAGANGKVYFLSPTGESWPKPRPRPRPLSPSPSRPMALLSPQPVSAALSRSSNARRASSRIRWLARASGMVGRFLSRQSHTIDGRRRPDDPPVGCDRTANPLTRSRRRAGGSAGSFCR